MLRARFGLDRSILAGEQCYVRAARSSDQENTQSCATRLRFFVKLRPETVTRTSPILQRADLGLIQR